VIRRRTIWLAALVAIVAVAVLGTAMVVMLPDIVRRAAVWRLEALTQRRVTIERVELNVFTGDVAVHGVRIADRDEAADLARVELIKARVHRRSLLELHIWIEDLVVERSSVRIVRLAGNRFNISDLLDRPTRPPSGVGVTVDHLRVTDGTVVLEDRTLRPARTWKSERIAIEARNLSTTRGDGSASGSTVVAGAPVHVHVEDLRLAPIHVRAHVTVGSVDLALLRLYLPGDAMVLPESGILAAGVTVVHDARNGTVISAGARIQQLALERRGQDVPFATSPETLVTLNDLHLKDGGFAVARAELEGDLNLTEAIMGPPVTYAFKATRLVAEALTWPTSRPGRISFTSGVPGGGAIDIRGTVQSAPLRADAQVKVSSVDLAHANRYAATAGRVSGVGDVDARVVTTWDRGLRLAVTGNLGASRVTVTDSRAPSAPPVLTADRVDATGLEYEWPARLKLDSLRVRRPSAIVERDAAGALTLPELFARQAPAGAPGGASGGTPDISVGELRVDGGVVTLVDNTVTPAARIQLANVALGVRDATWPVKGPWRTELSAGLSGGGVVTLSGTADVDGQSTRNKVTLKNIDVAQAQPFLPFRGRVSGRVDADLDVRGRLDPLRLRVRGDIVVNEAAVEDRDQPLLAVERVGLGGVDFRWPMRLEVEQLSVRRPWAKIARNERGELTLRAAFLARPGLGGRGAPADAAATAAKPEVIIKRALIEDGATSVIDDSVEPAARFEIRGTRLEARNITYPVKLPAEVTLATPMPGGGRLEGRGTFQVDPGRLDLRATLSGVALAPAQPYLPVDARVTGVVDGDVRIAGTFEPLAVNVRGNATIGDLAVGDEHRALLTAGRARAQGVHIEWPGRVRVESVEVDKPWLLLERDPAGRLPLLSLLTPHTSASPASRSDDDAKPRRPPRVDIGTATVSDGFGRFVDRVPDPDFAEELSAVNATVSGFSTAPGTVARATLRATLGPSAALAISGELTPPTGPRRYDVLVTVSGYPAPRANPYLQTLFGWRARQGTITLAAHYALNGDELEATNDVGAADLVVERAPGQQPPKWPIGLPLDTFVSLLKNRDGDTQLSVPIHGTLSSPKFEVGDAIATALRGIAIKTVTLPFSLVGRVFVNEQERVESLYVNPVLFEPGTATLAPGMAEHVQNLAVFLRDKPAVRLLQRPVLTVEDVTRLKRTALRERVRAAAGERTPTAMRDALTALYVEKFPRRAPAAVDEMIAALAEYDPAPTAATRALAERRVQSVREALGGRGVPPGRLPVIDAAAAVEAEGTGRVEFEITE
jgi:uncharacterized protein involved in outer membrane biogenesis